MKSDWFVSPQALIRARLAQLLNQEQLAKKSGVSVRSISRYEREALPVRLETLQCLAKALVVQVRDIAAIRAKTGPATKRALSVVEAPAVRPPPAPTFDLPARTPLETMIDLERTAGVTSERIETARGPAEGLSAKRLQDVFTAYALYDGDRFFLHGVVSGMRAVAPSEASLLGSRGGIAARFNIAKEIAPGHPPLSVTVHTAKAEHTKALIDLSKVGVTLYLRVVVAPGEPQDDGPGFSAFVTRIAVKRPWTFVVEEIVADGAARPTAGAGGSPKKKRTSSRAR